MALGLLHQNVFGKFKHLPSQLQIGRLLFIFFLSGCYVLFLCSVALDRIIFAIFSIGGLFLLLSVLLVFLLFTVLAISVFAVFLRFFFSICDSGGIKFLATSGLGRLGIFAVGNLDFHLFIFHFRADTFAIRSGLAFFFGASGSCLGTRLSIGLLVCLWAGLSVDFLVCLGACLSIGHLLVRLGTSLAILGAGHLLIF